MLNAYIAPQAARCSGALHHRQSGQAAYRLYTKPAHWACSHAGKCSSDLPFNGLHPRIACNYMDYYSFTDPEG